MICLNKTNSVYNYNQMLIINLINNLILKIFILKPFHIKLWVVRKDNQELIKIQNKLKK